MVKDLNTKNVFVDKELVNVLELVLIEWYIT